MALKVWNECEGYSGICFCSEEIARVLSKLFKLSGAEAVCFQCRADRGCLLHREEAGRKLKTPADEGFWKHFWHSRSVWNARDMPGYALVVSLFYRRRGD